MAKSAVHPVSKKEVEVHCGGRGKEHPESSSKEAIQQEKHKNNHASNRIRNIKKLRKECETQGTAHISLAVCQPTIINRAERSAFQQPEVGKHG